MQKTFLFFFWYFSTTSLIVFLSFFGYKKIIENNYLVLDPRIFSTPTPEKTLYGTGTFFSQVKGVNTSIQTGDARPIILSEFLKTNGSPLIPYDYYGQILTDIADKYGLDFRLLPSIMMQESNLCKKIPKGSYNCLGLGIHSEGTWSFSRYEDNFESAAKVLRKNYLDKGYITPEEIQDKYTPGSNGSWEYAVNHFMDILETAEFD